MKTCSRCKEAKPLDDFHRHRQSKDGRNAWCKKCESIYHAGYYRINKARLDEQSREYVKANSPSVTEYRREWNRNAYINSPRKQLSCKLRQGLKRRPTASPITLDELVAMYERQEGRCALTGIMMTRLAGRILPTSISIDRINSTGGYSLGNVRLICHAVNAFKGAGTDDEMFEIAEALLANGALRRAA